MACCGRAIKLMALPSHVRLPRLAIGVLIDTTAFKFLCRAEGEAGL